MSWIGYCQQCGSEVALNDDFSCQNGHQRSQIRGVRDAVTGLPYVSQSAATSPMVVAQSANDVASHMPPPPPAPVSQPVPQRSAPYVVARQPARAVNTVPHIVSLVIGLLVLAPVGLILFLDIFSLDAGFDPAYLVVAAILFAIFWFVGSSLTRSYERIVESAQSSASARLEIPRSLNRAYGFMLLSLLPYLLYLFVFALYCVEFIVVWGIIGISGAGRIPLFLPIGLFIMAVGSLWGVAVGLWKLIVPPRPDPVGASLSRTDCPRLWALADKVAIDAGTKTVDAIILTSDAGVSVWEEGVLPVVLTGRGRRHMQIGLAAIHDMTVCELMSILRHEYAHFANSDTRWGSFTHAMGQSLVSAFAATPGISSLSNGFSWVGLVLAANPAWFVYALFVRLFFRSTAGFSRLGEVLADRDAIVYAGGNTFAGALTKVVVNDWVYTQWLTSQGIEVIRDNTLPVPQIAATVSATARSMTIEESQSVREKAVASDQTDRGPYDSHPLLASRLAVAHALQSLGLQDNCEPAWSLIDDWNARDRQVSDLWFNVLRLRVAAS